MHQGYGQVKGYVLLGDSVYSQGFISYDSRKPEEIRFGHSRYHSYQTYTIAKDNITAFGFMDSTLYVVKDVLVQDRVHRLFVEVLGDSVLYYLHRDGAFYKSEAPHEQVLKPDLLPYLQSKLPASSKWNKELHLFRLRRGPMRYFANNLNGGIPPPAVMFLNAGVFTGFNHSLLRNKDITMDGSDATSYNISGGLFLETPFWSVRNVSLLSQVGYGLMRFNTTSSKTNKDRHDYKLDLDFLRLSAMPRYTLSLRSMRISAFAGPSGMYLLRNSSMSVLTLTEGNQVFVSTSEGAKVEQSYLFGYEVGGGISFFYQPGHYAAISLSQSRNYSGYFNISNKSLTLSLNL